MGTIVCISLGALSFYKSLKLFSCEQNKSQWYLVFSIWLLMGALIFARPAQSQPLRSPEMEAFIDGWFNCCPTCKPCQARERRAVREMIPAILKASNDYQIDPLLIAYIISKESSWRPEVVGFARNEIGLMQVTPRNAKKFKCHGLETIQGQVECGSRVLKKALETCDNDLLGAFNVYGTGKCKPVLKFAKRRLRQYRRILKKYRGSNDEQTKRTSVSNTGNNRSNCCVTNGLSISPMGIVRRRNPRCDLDCIEG